MKCFVVMQGSTYQEEKELGFIWASKLDSSGMVSHSWERMTEVNEGDRVFHYVKRNIVAVSVATTGCQLAYRPVNLQNYESWNNKGYLVELDYHELEIPINIPSNFDNILPHLPIKYSPFQTNADGNQGYLYPCNEELSIELLELIGDLNIYQEDDVQLELAIGTVRPTERNTFIPLIFETESEAKAMIRLGRKKFRENLIPLWEHQCALCGIELPALLLASYSKPWKDSTELERLDPYNGILLCSNHGMLYEKGFIAFDGQGRLHISTKVPPGDYEKYGIHTKMKIARKEENKPYFRWHKRHLFLSQNK
ncbi:HNH endonuclease [Sporosarcina sp. G11-34]|uniref:HNH endonuclease n=1 Tax=Sporosarcina sp. G11-34 TaxID=2849605 RepID=UPI0022A9583B|nr:HNH endonuclease [Sporosarcina sp. G11-34]MCZ2259961.1 HNH endonuclease [Sporosarcina sp. G11-34]